MFPHRFDQLNPTAAITSPGFKAQADPCSRETVLSVLRASRKRDDYDERAHEAGQKSKRRYTLKTSLVIRAGIINSFSLAKSYKVLSIFLLLMQIYNSYAYLCVKLIHPVMKCIMAPVHTKECVCFVFLLLLLGCSIISFVSCSNKREWH